ncbi:MAG: SdrD B-like domain-containing protein, partial [Actinomycetota bacterium]
MLIGKRSRGAYAATLFVVFAVASAGLAVVPAREVSAASGTISGTVYQDYNADGSLDVATTVNPADTGVGGVRVRAYDSTGALVGVATTASNGTYSLAVSNAATTAVRIEFDTPEGFVESPSMTPTTGSNNSSRPTAIQFTVVPDSGINFSIAKPDEYLLGTSDRIVGVTFQKGPSTYNSLSDTIASTTWSLASPTWNLANWGETGALWGLAWNRTTKRLWSSAVIRRGSGLGPKGIGGLYVTDTTGNTSSNVIKSFDLVAEKGLTLSSGTNYSDASRDLTGTDEGGYTDTPGFNGVGLEGIGDIDVSTDDRYLYVVNLYERKLHRIELGGTADDPTLGTVTDFAFPDTYCTAPRIARPWGIETNEDGTVNAGVVCTQVVSGANVSAASRTGGGVILRLDPAASTWSKLVDVNLNYMRLTDWSYSPAVIPLRDVAKYWHQWTNDWPAIWGLMSLNNEADGKRNLAYTQPIISDIETGRNGELVVGLTDRFNFQWTNEIVSPDPADSLKYKNGFATGDTVYFCKTASGYLQDSDAGCKADQDFIADEWSGTCYGTTCSHYETALGALAAYPPDTGLKVAKTAFDPGYFNRNGVNTNSLSNGSYANGSAWFNDQTFGKQAAMGDIEVLLDQIPLTIGNRLWKDEDNDGIQDAGELPVVGATVRLYNSAGSLVGTAVTNANGEYYFSSAVSEAANGGATPDYSGGGLTANAAFTVRIDNPTDYTTAGRLKDYALTAPNRLSSTSSLDDSIDSDGTVVESYPRIAVAPMSWGSTDMSLDFGFSPKVSIGDTVWVDMDRDQVLDTGEVGLAGATVTITKADGSPVYDVSGNLVTTTLTDANGKYLFDNLPLAPAGTYKTSITVPAGYVATTPTFDTSLALTTAGASDLTLDFGVVPVVSVGDRVWFDTNVDGIQNGSDYGIAGVTVRITKSDGTAVTDVYGRPVGDVTTDANGNYTFANLPYGTYKTNVVTAPNGLVPTLTGQGTAATDSTTGVATSAALSTPGASDTTLDFGFYAPVVSVGNKVWFDTDGDGIQDDGEPGIAGVTLTIKKADGTSVTDVYGNAVNTTTTDANGNYSFANLPYGSYTVTATTPSGMTATLNGVGGGGTDSGTAGSDPLDATRATSRNMTTANDSDTTLDFGFIAPKVSVGNFVWFDLNNNGIQDDAASGLSGVVVSITKASDGSAVTDVYGNAVTSTLTDANGAYLFKDLPVGQYKVTVTTPTGMTPAQTGQGTTSTDSSTDFAISNNLTTDGASDLTLDFGFYAPPAVVGSRVWSDLDGDGIQDAGEPGIAGVVLSVRDANGNPVTAVGGGTVANVTTDADGNYVFKDLPLGTTYTVTVVSAPAEYIASPPTVGSDRAVDSSTGSATSALMTVTNLTDFTLDFGFVPKVSVGNLVWLDADRDGVQDAGEPGIAGVTLTITKADGSAVTDVNGASVTTTVTDANGNYSFTNLPPGSYKVTVTSPAGYSATTAGAGTTLTDSSTGNATSANLVTGGANDTTLDFGFVLPLVSVGNLVWKDTNGDGIKDSGEPGISGVTVTITKADGTPVVDAAGRTVTTTVTDADGEYLFENLPVGQYIVSVATPATLTPTIAGAGTTSTDSSTGSATSTVLTTNGASDLTLDFGFVDLPVTVGSLVWVDKNGDGIQDLGEFGLAGVTLTISKVGGGTVTDVNGNPVTTTTTSDANGNYSFTGLAPGQYTVTVGTPPTGYVATVAGVGADRSVDSSTESATSSVLLGGTSDNSLDFGFSLPAVSVGNYVWVDSDRDGIQDSVELGIAGVTLTITTPSGGPVTNVLGQSVTTTTTDANGFYLFEDLPYGSYKVTVTPPAGYIATTALAGSDRGTDSSTGSATSANLTTTGASDLTLDFGFVVPAVSVGNLVWFDTDRDGVQDAGESGIAGVTLSITKADGSAVTDVNGNAVTTTMTDRNGNYLFADLPIGSYKVSVVTPSGYLPTVAGAGTTSTDSSTGFATSANLATDGASDQTLDFGFIAPRVSVGNLVWFDTNHDGVQDANEAGIAGAVLSITKMDGSPVTNVFGATVGSITTDASGRFLFENLPPGQYKVSIANPAGFMATVAGSGTGATDSAIDTDTSVNLPNDGDSDMTLDFGFFPVSVSVGDFVWLDADKDGVQDADEKGIAGVTLTLTKSDGTAVTDVFGNAVTTTTTDANGKYLFANLPPGTYKVSVTAPAGYVSTVSGAGTSATDSSTGSATS